MRKHGPFKIISRPIRRLYLRENTVTGRLRIVLLTYCYIPVIVLGIAANFLGLTEPSAQFFKYTHTALISVAAMFLVLFYKSQISVGVCLSAMTIIGQTVVSIEMLYCANRPTDYYTMLIMANMVLLAMNTMVSMAGQLKYTTVVLGISALATYIACAIITGDETLQSFIGVFSIAFAFVSITGFWVVKAVNNIEDENQQIKKDESDLLHILRLRKHEVKAYLELASQKTSIDGTRILLKRLTNKSRENLLANVEEYIVSRDTEKKHLKKVFPDFTPSEIEICYLILHGKKLTEICKTLGKTETNVNSQRAKMRKKLELQPSDNLREKLQNRINQANS